MKCYCLVFMASIAITVHTGRLTPVQQNRDRDSETPRIVEVIKAKCDKSSLQAFDDLKESLQGALMCFQGLAAKHFEDVHNLRDFYDKIVPTDGFQQCLAPVGDKLRACLYEEETFLPDFIYGAFNFTVAEFSDCGAEAREKLQYIKEMTRSDECLSRSSVYENAIKTCFPDLAIFRTAHADDHNFVVKESEICVDMVNLEECIKTSINEECGRKDYTKFVHLVMEPFLNWCTKHQENLKINLEPNKYL